MMRIFTGVMAFFQFCLVCFHALIIHDIMTWYEQTGFMDFLTSVYMFVAFLIGLVTFLCLIMSNRYISKAEYVKKWSRRAQLPKHLW